MILPAAVLAFFAAAVSRGNRREARRMNRKSGDPQTAAVARYAREVSAKRRKAARKLVRYFYLGGRNRTRIARLQQAIGHVTVNGFVDEQTRFRCIELLGPDAVQFGPDKVARPKRAPSGPGKKRRQKKKPSEPARLPGTARKKKRRKAPEQPGEPPLLPPPSPPEPKKRRRKKKRPEPTPAPTPAPVPKKRRRKKKRPAPEQPKRLPAPDPKFEAADALNRYLTQGGRERATVAEYQRVMGGLDPDGLPGAKTAARVTELGVTPTWPDPVKMTGGAPAPAGSKAAANELADYLSIYDGVRRDRIAAYQKVMGLTADGIAGPKTKAKIKELTGRTVA